MDLSPSLSFPPQNSSGEGFRCTLLSYEDFPFVIKHLSRESLTLEREEIIDENSSEQALLGYLLKGSDDSLITVQFSLAGESSPVFVNCLLQSFSMRKNHSSGRLWCLTLSPCGEGVDQIGKLLLSLRKSQHLELCENHPIEHTPRFTGFEKWSFLPTSLPTLCPSEVSTAVSWCGRSFSMPFFITPMSGGTELGKELNKHLAEVCAELNIPMGVGSQRIALEAPHLRDTFAVKKHTKDVFLIGNLGISQLSGPDYLKNFHTACEMIEADVMSIHVNLLQELLQEEGQRVFPNLWKNLEECLRRSPVPVMVKEVGCGMDLATAKRLESIGVSVIDVGGAGGTSWAAIEGKRHSRDHGRALGEVYRNWGIPTAYSLYALKGASLKVSITATGGMRDGLQGAKAYALGADMIGLGLPVLKAALKDLELAREGKEVKVLKEELLGFQKGFLLAQALSSSATPGDLRSSGVLQKTPYPYDPDFMERR